MMIDTTPLWGLLGFSYVSVAIYYETRYGDMLSNYTTGAFLFVGIAIAILVNRRLFVSTELVLYLTELAILLMLILALLSGWAAVKIHVRSRMQHDRKYGL